LLEIICYYCWCGRIIDDLPAPEVKLYYLPTMQERGQRG